jgi:endonuclease/exonuclease/phosphatase family metal-dependent hydrolase
MAAACVMRRGVVRADSLLKGEHAVADGKRMRRMPRGRSRPSGCAIAAVLTAVAILSTPPTSRVEAAQPASPRAEIRYRLHPSPDRGAAEAARWAAAVGPAVIESHSAAVAVDDLAVVSWNLHGDAGDLEALVNRVRDGDLLGPPPAGVILLLQEAVRHSADVPALLPPDGRFARPLSSSADSRLDLQETARKLGLSLAYVPSMRNGRGQQDRGNAILSSLPFDAVEAFELPLGRQRRVAVSLTVRTASPSRPLLRFVSVHFDTAVSFSHGGPARWRRRQAEAVIAALASVELPTVIGGDLNTWWGEDEPAVSAMRDAYPEAVDRHSGVLTWRGPAGAGNRLDYLFAAGCNRTVEVDRLTNRFGSDHHPIYARMRLP